MTDRVRFNHSIIGTAIECKNILNVRCVEFAGVLFAIIKSFLCKSGANSRRAKNLPNLLLEVGPVGEMVEKVMVEQPVYVTPVRQKEKWPEETIPPISRAYLLIIVQSVISIFTAKKSEQIGITLVAAVDGLRCLLCHGRSAELLVQSHAGGQWAPAAT